VIATDLLNNSARGSLLLATQHQQTVKLSFATCWWSFSASSLQ